MNAATGTVATAFVCPACRHPLESLASAWRCSGCARSYPIVAGIPDLRIAPDPWLGIDEDRDKALRLEAMTLGMSFEEAVRTYWRITPSTPEHLAERYIRHVLAAEARSTEWLDAQHLSNGSGGVWIDAGCGTGDLLAPLLRRGVSAIGVDIALRWLVIARRRPNVDHALLVCCNAEALPFADGTCAALSALGLLEHCRDEHAIIREAHRVLDAGAPLFVRTTNRYSLLPEPHVNVWGVGFLPRRLADGYVRRRSGERYQHHRPLSVRELRSGLRTAGFRDVRVAAGRLLNTELPRLPHWAKPLVRLYRTMRELPLLGRALAWFAPLLDAEATRP